MKRKTIWWILIFLWAIFIFTQSNQVAVESSKESDTAVLIINNFITSLTGIKEGIVTSSVVRKCAHFVEYMILGFLLLNGFYRRDRIKQALMFSVSAGIFYAISDEVHQFFVPGRSMRLFDVFIDSLGILCGTLLVYLYSKKRVPFVDT